MKHQASSLAPRLKYSLCHSVIVCGPTFLLALRGPRMTSIARGGKEGYIKCLVYFPNGWYAPHNYHFLGSWALQSPARAKCYFYPFSITCSWHVPPGVSSVYYTARCY